MPDSDPRRSSRLSTARRSLSSSIPHCLFWASRISRARCRRPDLHQSSFQPCLNDSRVSSASPPMPCSIDALGLCPNMSRPCPRIVSPSLCWNPLCASETAKFLHVAKHLSVIDLLGLRPHPGGGSVDSPRTKITISLFSGTQRMNWHQLAEAGVCAEMPTKQKF